jgi:diguanylate cyclase (GGDEF)-like protein
MTEKILRVLLAEGDSGETARALRALFPLDQGRMDLTMLAALSTLVPSIEIVNPEIILIDLSLAQPDPLAAVRRIHRAAPAVPLIVVAEEAEKDNAARCLSEGAFEYLLKGWINPKTLDRVLRRALEQNILDGLTDLLRDPLTGLYIHDGFLTLGARAMETAKRNNSTLVLLCARIENLGSLREDHGMSAVENSLREVAAIITSSFRRTDIVARIGDSQFAALAVDAVEPSAPVLLQRLRVRIAALNRHTGACGPIQLRLNARFWSPKDASTFSEFLDSVEAGLRISPVESEKAPARNREVITWKEV